MRLPRIILPILLVALVMLSLYLLIALPLLQDPDIESKQHQNTIRDYAQTESAVNTDTHSSSANKSSRIAPSKSRSDSNAG